MYDKGLGHKTFVMVVIFVAVFCNHRVSWFIYVLLITVTGLMLKLKLLYFGHLM